MIRKLRWKFVAVCMGLAIADTIAWEHKGALKAESDAASTRFTFTMPLRKQA